MNHIVKTARIGKECVACGCCAAVCPKEAISIRRGVTAQVNDLGCIGCGKCARVCPAAVIELSDRSDFS